MLPEENGSVPNFVGGTLPRSDQGDREYYCSTMLALFKPWRSGKDLMTYDQTWDDSFRSFPFSDRQKQVMEYFNVRYECLDSRDNFNARRKQTPMENNKLYFIRQWTMVRMEMKTITSITGMLMTGYREQIQLERLLESV